MKRLLLFSLFFFVGHFGFSQNNSSLAYAIQADSLYRHQSYHYATIYYEKALKKAENVASLMLRIAKCYGNMNKIQEAESWFKKAKLNQAVFSDADAYQYAHILMMLQKRDEAEAELIALLKVDSTAAFARQTLDDIRNYGKYYKDSSRYEVKPLNINTPLSEFSPAFYNDGIVFSSAQPQNFTKKKSPHDNSHFLNLYYSPRLTENNFKTPVEFDKKVDSRFHNGPATFYNNGHGMIINRNEQHQLGSKKAASSLWHLALYDAKQNVEKNQWQFTSLPFNEPPYSLAHPSISSDGNILYFSSNRPGGYGGNDIYRVVRRYGVWGTPFNVGPSINTAGDEEFPFFINHTLYFSSNGHGGLGGLDIFKSDQAVNGFTPAVNMGYPVNSNFDDLSIILLEDENSGYFSSARKGNDDLFFVRAKTPHVEMLARIYDGQTKKPLSNATAQLITGAGKTIDLASDSAGLVHYALPTGTAYTIIGMKDGKTGKLSGEASMSEDHIHVTHSITAYGDTARVACVGTIQNNEGFLKDAVKINIIDRTSGKAITSAQQHSLINFQGEKGHTYDIEIQNEKGESSKQELILKPNEPGIKTWTMFLPDTPSAITLAAKVFNADNQEPLAGAQVKIITFSESDQEFTANEAGIVEFVLPLGTAYVVLGSKDGLTGMHSGIAEVGTDKATIIHPVPAKGDPANPFHVFALVTNAKGEVVNNVHAIVTDKTSGEKIPAEIKDGTVTFLATRGKEYIITADHPGYETFMDKINIPEYATSVEKVAIQLNEKKSVLFQLAARVFQADNNQPLAGAHVKIITFEEADLDLLAYDDGVVDFSLPEGTPYVVLGSKDGYTGMHAGMVEPGTDKASIVHPVPARNDAQNQITIIGQVTNKQGDVLPDAQVIVTDNITGKKMPAQYLEGLLSFVGDKGKSYTVAVEDQAYEPGSEQIHIPEQVTVVDKIAVVLERKFTPLVVIEHVPVIAFITSTRGSAVKDATVMITDDATGQAMALQQKEGVLSFLGEKGKSYTVSVDHADFQPASEQIVIPAEATEVNKTSITLVDKNYTSLPEKNETVVYSMAARVFKAENNESLGYALVKVITFTESDLELTANNEGLVEFSLPEGTPYVIVGNKDLYTGMHSGVVDTGEDKASVILPVPARSDQAVIPVVSQIINKQGEVLKDAQVHIKDNSTSNSVAFQFSNGLLTFLGDPGKTYTIAVNDQNYEPLSKQITLQANNRGVDKNSIVLERKPKRSQRTSPIHKTEPAGTKTPATLLILQANDEKPTAYLISSEGVQEIFEKDGILYLQGHPQTREIGPSTLTEFQADPNLYQASVGFEPGQIVTLQNIYFDYNSSQLDEADKQELNKAKNLLRMYPALQLKVNAHADDRGDETYNLNLSKKRAKAIASYLKHAGGKYIITTHAYGESLPAIPCLTPGCTEDQHQKNRRAEFSLQSKEEVFSKASNEQKNIQEKQAENEKLEDEHYGSKTMEGLYFKVSIGAYRYNHSLTFNNLKDIGTIETDLKDDGIMYYYLSGAATLKEIKNLRKQVIKRGVTDAAITVFYKGAKISIAEFKALVAP